jgi:hypothetical protein
MGQYALNVLKGVNLVDWDTADLRVGLLGTGYTPDIDGHDNWDDCSAQEISVSGYTAGGAALTSVAVAYDTANNRAEAACANVAWTFAASATPKWAMLYANSGNPSTSPLICYWELAGVAVSGQYTLVVDPEGIFQARASAQVA